MIDETFVSVFVLSNGTGSRGIACFGCEQHTAIFFYEALSQDTGQFWRENMLTRSQVAQIFTHVFVSPHGCIDGATNCSTRWSGRLIRLAFAKRRYRRCEVLLYFSDFPTYRQLP